MSSFRRIPFWEKQRGDGPVARWAAMQQCRAEQRKYQEAFRQQESEKKRRTQDVRPPDPEEARKMQAAIQRERELSRDRSIRVVRKKLPHCSIHGFDVAPSHDSVSQMLNPMTLESGLITEKLKQ